MAIADAALTIYPCERHRDREIEISHATVAVPEGKVAELHRG